MSLAWEARQGAGGGRKRRAMCGAPGRRQKPLRPTTLPMGSARVRFLAVKRGEPLSEASPPQARLGLPFSPVDKAADTGAGGLESGRLGFKLYHCLLPGQVQSRPSPEPQLP